MNAKLNRLLLRFSHESSQTAPRDQELLALAYINDAYELCEEEAVEEPTERAERVEPTDDGDSEPER